VIPRAIAFPQQIPFRLILLPASPRWQIRRQPQNNTAMSTPLKNSTWGTPKYGPFPDGTVQTYFRFSRPHVSPDHPYRHVDLDLVAPSLPRDVKIRSWHGIKV
jgi:hypothetical protein